MSALLADRVYSYFTAETDCDVVMLIAALSGIQARQGQAEADRLVYPAVSIHFFQLDDPRQYRAEHRIAVKIAGHQ